MVGIAIVNIYNKTPNNNNVYVSLWFLGLLYILTVFLCGGCYEFERINKR